MGISKGSVWGNIKQSVGSAVGYRLKGQNVVRQKPLSYNDANSLQQQKNRKIQAVLVLMYRQFRNSVQRMFAGMPETYSDYNSFVSLSHGAVTVDDSLVETIDGELVVISKGTAQNVSNIAVVSSGQDQTISWDTTYDSVNGFPGDIVNVVIYDAVNNLVTYSNVGTLTRSTGQVVVPTTAFPDATHLLFSVKNVNNVPSNTLSVAYPLV